jgi:hypothetical protein
MRLPAQFLNWANGGAMPEPLQMAAGLWDRTTYRYNTMLEAESSYADMLLVVVGGGVGDISGLGALAEAITGESSAQGGLSEQERKNKWVEGSFAALMYVAGAAVPKGGGPKGKYGNSGGGTPSPKPSKYASYSDAEFLTEVATRAERYGVRKGWGAKGTGSKQGTLKHTYARDVLRRYQRMTKQRQHLQTEQSWFGFRPSKYGAKGSARPDVYDPLTGTVYDYKFTRKESGISRAQQTRNLRNVPGVKCQIPIYPR